MEKLKIMDKLEAIKVGHSAWSKGVKQYAFELLDNLSYAENYNSRNIEKSLLNGASDWKQYSEGGCSLIYDRDIAERLCSPYELRKTRNGERNPNSRENWLQCQARALFQASMLVKNILE